MNFFKFLERQKLENRQAFIVHFPPASGKTHFALQLCQRDPGLLYVDLLETYTNTPGLPKVADFGPQEIKKWLLSLPCHANTHTLILDHGDFIFNTWNADEKKQFISWLHLTLKASIDTDITLVFFNQTDGVISDAKMINSYGESRILKLSDFDAL
jgi:hypothetical protein